MATYEAFSTPAMESARNYADINPQYCSNFKYWGVRRRPISSGGETILYGKTKTSPYFPDLVDTVVYMSVKPGDFFYGLEYNNHRRLEWVIEYSSFNVPHNIAAANPPSMEGELPLYWIGMSITSQISREEKLPFLSITRAEAVRAAESLCYVYDEYVRLPRKREVALRLSEELYHSWLNIKSVTALVPSGTTDLEDEKVVAMFAARRRYYNQWKIYNDLFKGRTPRKVAARRAKFYKRRNKQNKR